MSAEKHHTQSTRTTLYLTTNNKEWLAKQPKGQRTQIINEAIKNMRNEQDNKERKNKLLKTLENLPLYKTHGISPKDILNQERDRYIES